MFFVQSFNPPKLSYPRECQRREGEWEIYTSTHRQTKNANKLLCVACVVGDFRLIHAHFSSFFLPARKKSVLFSFPSKFLFFGAPWNRLTAQYAFSSVQSYFFCLKTIYIIFTSTCVYFECTIFLCVLFS